MKKTDREEILNTISHGVAAICSVIGFIILIKFSKESGEIVVFYSSIIYGLSLIIMYTSSTIYHSSKNIKTKKILRILDHCSIYVFIAGSYTPILLIAMSGPATWWLFSAQWILVLIGIIFKIFYTGKLESLSMFIYLVMGWMIVFKWDLLVNSTSGEALNLLLYGGIIYTIGVFFYLLDTKIKYFHFIWHLFVIIGSILHYIMILKHVVIQ
ncbi:MAG: hypothetical protein CMD26_06585 [Flavobacteriales bacterium]|nr:hypothetical protein [Flavobacteriales bacterium]